MLTEAVKQFCKTPQTVSPAPTGIGWQEDYWQEDFKKLPIIAVEFIPSRVCASH